MNAKAKTLIEAARLSAKNAYCPYSDFSVGAALLTTTGKIFTGCNVENASFGLTICAERVALASAIAQGARQFAALALVGGENAAATPCGACLQVLAEFCSPDMPIYAAPHKRGLPLELTLSDCMPITFTAEDLKKEATAGTKPTTEQEAAPNARKEEDPLP